jgi:hypothetical protein
MNCVWGSGASGYSPAALINEPCICRECIIAIECDELESGSLTRLLLLVPHPVLLPVHHQPLPYTDISKEERLITDANPGTQCQQTIMMDQNSLDRILRLHGRQFLPASCQRVVHAC